MLNLYPPLPTMPTRRQLEASLRSSEIQKFAANRNFFTGLYPVDRDGHLLPDWASDIDQWGTADSGAEGFVIRTRRLHHDHDLALKVFFRYDPIRYHHYGVISKLNDPFVEQHYCWSSGCHSLTHSICGSQGPTIDLMTMPWIEGMCLDEFISDNRSSRDGRRQIALAAAVFRETCGAIHAKGLSHGDLCCDNIIVQDKSISSNGLIRFVFLDLDTLCHRTHVSPFLRHVGGHDGFQSSARTKDPTKFIGHPYSVDFISELIIYLSMLVYASTPPPSDTMLANNWLTSSLHRILTPTVIPEIDMKLKQLCFIKTGKMASVHPDNAAHLIRVCQGRSTWRNLHLAVFDRLMMKETAVCTLIDRLQEMLQCTTGSDNVFQPLENLLKPEEFTYIERMVSRAS